MFISKQKICSLIIIWFWITAWLQHNGAQLDKYNSKKKLLPD